MPPATRRRAAAREPAATAAVARVAVDVPLAHLDRPFDYLVPAALDEQAAAGVRVRVRFAGQLVDGFVLERVEASAHPGRLAFLERVVSAEPVLGPELLGLARDVADRYAGTLADVLRLAVPPRHGGAEAAPSTQPALPPPAPADPGPWGDYPGGPQLLADLAAGRSPRHVWAARPGPDWPAALARAAQATLAGGRGALLVVPDQRDVARLDTALRQALGDGRHTVLTADLGPSRRYRHWLALRRGAVQAVVGTRAAMFAPVTNLGLVVVWDDGDDLHAQPRAPYPHARDVLLLRAHRRQAAALVGGFAVTAEAAALVRSGWARPLVAPRDVVRSAAPRVQAAGDDAELARDPAARSARLPHLAWQTAHDALAHGPVLVQVPRRGYRPVLSCLRCRAPARCPHCSGPLHQTSGHAVPACRWCGRPVAAWSCPQCGAEALRAVVVGAARTAEELGRAFPGVPVRTSGGDRVLTEVDAAPALVIATPGAEPPAVGGYAAALLLDGWALLTRPDLRAAEEALRRWYAAAALVRPAPAGGRVVVLAAGGLPVVQALLRWQPAWHAERELDERTALGFPPAVRMAVLTGSPAAVADLLTLAELPGSAQVLGPVPVPVQRGAEQAADRALVRVPRADGRALASALKAAQSVRTARKAADPVRVQLDPVVLG